jgi:hypothetical protein
MDRAVTGREWGWVVPRNWERMRVPPLRSGRTRVSFHGVKEIVEYLIIPHLIRLGLTIKGRRTTEARRRNLFLVGRSWNRRFPNAGELPAAPTAAQAFTRRDRLVNDPNA